MNTSKQALLLLVIALAVMCMGALNACGQVQFSAGGSLLKGSGYYDNHAYLVGGSATMEYVFKDFITVGVNGRMYQANTTAYQDYNASDKQQNISALASVVFRHRQKFKPTLGISYGIANSSHMINYVRYDEKKQFGGLYGGFLYNLGQSTGLVSRLGYNYMPGGGQQRVIEGVNNPVLTEGINRFVSFDIGLFVRLYTRQ